MKEGRTLRPGPPLHCPAWPCRGAAKPRLAKPSIAVPCHVMPCYRRAIISLSLWLVNDEE